MRLPSWRRIRDFGVAGLVQIPEAESVGMTAEDFGAGEAPDDLRHRVEMADVKIVIQDHDGIIRPLERGQQEVGGFGRGAVVCGHRGLDLNGEALLFREKRTVPTVSKRLCYRIATGGKALSLRIS